MRINVRYRQDLSNVEVECTHCGVRTSKHLGSGQTVRYFNCPSCYRWVSSSYAEVLRGDTKFVARPVEDAAKTEEFGQVKDRLERWLRALEDQDPYRALGVSPQDSDDQIRRRYRELALERHPDRGGSLDAMRDLNAAYDRIVSHRRTRPPVPIPAGQPAVAVSLPARSR